MRKKYKILLLFSGGLDSVLCYHILLNKGFKVKTVQFYTPFLHIKSVKDYIEDIYNKYKIPLEMIDIWNEYKEVLLKPEHGYGGNLNPCIDCKLLFYKKAGEIMEKEGFDFIATGEIAGQRPFSQRSDALHLLEKKSGLKGKILRPLSYDLSCKIDDEEFYNIKGRGRKTQVKLANEFCIKDIPTPAGGCLLTEPTYCAKVEQVFDFFKKQSDLLEKDYFEIIKYGRVILLNENILLIIGRNKEDGDKLEKFKKVKNGYLIVSKNLPGPVSLMVVKDKKDINKEKIFEKIKEFVKKGYKDSIEFEEKQCGM